MIPSRNPWRRRAILLEGDCPCVHCGYNLRGLAMSTSCPECGGRIWDSLLNRTTSALYQATRTAGGICAAMAACPLLFAALLALSHTASKTNEAAIITVVLAVAGLGWSSLGWFALPVLEFGPRLREKRWIPVLAPLAIGAIILAAILQITASSASAQWIPRAWDLSLGCACALFVLLLAQPSRMLFALGAAYLSRATQLTQLACAFAAFICAVTLAMELTEYAGVLHPAEHIASSVAAVAVTLTMSLASYSLGSYGPRR